MQLGIITKINAVRNNKKKMQLKTIRKNHEKAVRNNKKKVNKRS